MRRSRFSRRPKTYRNARGYSVYADSGVPVHRRVAAKKLKRPLRKGEVVHHIDRDKSNNHPGNLYVFKDQKSHDRAHKLDALRFGKIASYRGWKRK